MIPGYRTILIGTLTVILTVVPFFYYRSVYAHGKRLRVVEPGRVYRCGQLTEEGFAEVVKRLGIRTILNLQDDYPNPDVEKGYWKLGTIKETEMCDKLHVQYRLIEPDLISRFSVPEGRPVAVEKFLSIMDNPANYPVLIHCKAGLHRTGVLSAVYRMEYQGWKPAMAYQELRGHGFGDMYCTSSNDYVKQYVLTYVPGQRRNQAVATTSAH